jgi:hypothetical protein
MFQIGRQESAQGIGAGERESVTAVPAGAEQESAIAAPAGAAEAAEAPTALVAAMYLEVAAAAAGTEAHLEEDREATAVQVPVPAAAVALPVWDLVEAAVAVPAAEAEVEEEEDVGEDADWNHSDRSEDMRSKSASEVLLRCAWIVAGILAAIVVVCLFTGVGISAQSASAATTSKAQGSGIASFATPQQAADALVNAAEKFDVGTLIGIVGPADADLILTHDFVQDRQRAKEFAALAREKKSVSVDRATQTRAFLLLGKDDWPFPLPIVKKNDKWSFDAKAGRHELLARRIGTDELDAIQVCRGYVEAQYEYALKPREGYDVNQFAQRIVSTPGKQDGLAWQDPDGTWHGPAGENVARAIQAGYSDVSEPYHGYFFKTLKGQGQAAPLGAMDFVVNGAMIGGFALAAAPAEYGETGIMTLLVGYDGVVYQKDFGPSTLDQFKKMELYNPDKSWTPVPED